MKLRFLLSLCLAAFCAVTAPAEDIDITRFDVIHLPDFRLKADVSELEFTGAGRLWRLEIAPNLRLGDQLPALDAVHLYRGTVAGASGSWVRLNERAGIWSGVIFDGEEHFVLEAIETRDAGREPTAVMLYALADAVVQSGALGCGVDGMPLALEGTNLQQKFDGLASELRASAAAVATQRVDIAMIGDSQFAERHASDPLAALAERLNVVDGYYSEQVGVQLDVAEFRVLEASGDPFTSNDAFELLDELADYKFTETELEPLGLIHLYTGRNLDGNTAGIAFTGAICNARFGAALSEGRRNLSTDTLIFAHEFGHSFGAPHDGESGSACESTAEVFLMAPSINGSSTFSDCSLNEIRETLATKSCLTSVEPVDVLPIFSNFPVAVTIGQAFSGIVRARNNGSAAATVVELALEVPPSIELDQTTLPAECAPTATGAQCSIATIAADDQASFSFDFIALTPDAAEIVARSTTSNDANTGNDELTQTVLVSAATDLAAILDAPVEFSVGIDSSVSIGVRNESNDTATGVDVVLSVTGGLGISGATPDCTIANASVTCPVASLPGGLEANFSIELAGASAGDASLTVTVDADQVDPLTANNTVQQSVAVTEPADSDVDLGIAISGSGELVTGADSSYTVTVSNSSMFTADAVSVTIDVPAVLRIASTPGNCTTSGTSVDCDLGGLAGNDNAAVVLEVTSESAGSGSFTATVSSTSNDTDTGNNSTSLAVNVAAAVAPPPAGNGGGSSSGGGAGSPGAIVLLLLLAGIRRATGVANQRGNREQ